MQTDSLQTSGLKTSAQDITLATTAAQQIATAQALGRAFVRDPFMRYLFPDAATREQNTVKLLRPVIRYCTHYRTAELAPDQSGALVWIPGDKMHLSGFQLFRSGLIWTPFKIGAAAFQRLEHHDSLCEAAILYRAPAEFAYLWILGVCPEATGRGTGRALVQSAMERMRSRGHSACLLRTDNEQNIAFYQKLGFELVHAGDTSTDSMPGSGLRYWIFSKPLR